MAAPLLATMPTSSFGDDYGMPIVLAITGFGLCAAGGVLLGDALTPHPQEAVRTAGLAPRRVRDQVPPRMTPLLLLLAVSLVVLLAIGLATASPDAIGRAGRAITVTCNGVTKPISPWPGIFYGTPILASLTLGTAACAWALRRIAYRPGGDQQRRTRSRAITAAWGLLVTPQLLLVDLMIATVLTHTSCAGTLGTIAAVVIYPLGLLSLVALAWCLFTVAAPRAAQR
ncbi:hypothetical protein M878_29910 [Streptomyces roseochromogenus subsp. oscitans DS 12.976]|uniref:Uncharacterized protein n=1 Tax=Streptomyces roseochromogenus subsp. oscitans DS 12.976 TaxID=1352936 RepID=V6JY22_STRRC|nr:hypothetical protein M878_29910 [Streptomyces roseochromogenus subsp. oscitans DS 12.976]